jgi:hypothetical protein
MLEESPADLQLGEVKLERLRCPLEMTVEVLDELSPEEVQGLPGATVGA